MVTPVAGLIESRLPAKSNVNSDPLGPGTKLSEPTGVFGPICLNAPLARCERTASAAVLEGSIARLGSQYVLGLRAKNCTTGDVLDDEQAQAARKEDVLNALSQMARNFRSRVGESLATIRRHDTPLAEATTLSLEALKAYSAAWTIHAARGATAALPLFKRAAELDPEFAMAHASLGRIYADLDEPDLSMQSLERAWQLRGRASDRERFFITLNYEMLVTGDLEEARKTAEAWAQTYPRDAAPHMMLSGYVNKFPGRYEDAAAEARKAIELDPDFGVGYYNLAVNNAYLERLDEAERVLQGSEARGLEPDEFVMLAFDLAFLKKDRAAMQRASERARRRSGPTSWISDREASALAYFGRLQQATSMSRRAIAEAQEGEQEERAGLWEVGAAVREALFGNTRQAKERANAALALSRDREVQYGAAVALAISGDTSQAQTLADELERRFSKDSCVRFSYLPVLGAMLAMNHREPSKAIEILHRAASYEMGAPRSSINALFGAMYPLYVRGQAYLTLHQSAAAAAEFQKILDHRGIVVSDPIGALAHLQLGRAFALSGDKAQAKAAYDDFLSLWKDADPDIPIFRRAKAEYAKLQ